MVRFASFLCLVAVLLSALLLAAPLVHARHAGYPEWQKPKRCVFAMPYVGRAVLPDETGTVTEVLKEVFDRQDVDFEHRNLPYQRALAELERGVAHCTLVIKGHHDMEVLGGATIDIYDLAVAYRVKDGFKGVEAMEGKPVACLFGFDLKVLLPVKILVRTGFDLTSILHLLDRGHVDYVLDEASSIREAFLEAKLPTNEFGVHMLRTLEVHPAFASTDQGRAFRDIYDERMREMAKSGRLREILGDNGLGDKRIDQLFKINGW